MYTVVIVLFLICSTNVLMGQNSDSKIAIVTFDSTVIEQINTDNYPCITCEIIQSIFKKHFDELKHYDDFRIRKPAVYTEEEQIVYNMLFEFMTSSMKNIQSKVLDSLFRERIHLKRTYNFFNFDSYISEILDKVSNLNFTTLTTTSEYVNMEYYFLNFLYDLKDCPNQLIVSFKIETNAYFSFKIKQVIDEFKYIHKSDYIYLCSKDDELLAKYYPQETHHNRYIFVLSHYSLGKNYTAPCNRAYSIYKWDRSNLQSQRWIRMK